MPFVGDTLAGSFFPLAPFLILWMANPLACRFLLSITEQNNFNSFETAENVWEGMADVRCICWSEWCRRREG
jgi:hypothetical protein